MLRPEAVANAFLHLFPLGGSDPQTVKRAERMIRALRMKDRSPDSKAFTGVLVDGREVYRLRDEVADK